MSYRILLLACFLLIAPFSFSQSYVVTVRGDTVYHSSEYGKPEINYSHTFNSSGAIDYVEIREGFPKKSYTALQAKTVFIEGDVYHSIHYNDAYRFLKLIQDGYVRIYGYRIERQMEYNGRLLVKQGGSTLDVPSIQFRKALQKYFEDCESVVDRLKLREWELKDLNAAVEAYNNCIQEMTEARFRGDELKEELDKKLPLLLVVQDKVKSLTNFPEKLDALDLLEDIKSKIEAGKKIPNYQIDALKEYLASQKEIGDDLDKLIKVLR